jgi:acetoacetyl-CoA synthetase
MLLKSLIQEQGFNNFAQLHAWSCANPDKFWSVAWDQLGIQGEKGEAESIVSGFFDSKWFPEGRLNVVDTLLQGDISQEVLVQISEAGERVALTRGELASKVAACAKALGADGVKAGDRVAAWMPNVAETIIWALAALSIGAVVSTASTDFGPSVLVDRFGQIEPKLLLVSSNYTYGGKEYSLVDKIPEVLSQLPTVNRVVLVGQAEGFLSFEDFLAPHADSKLETVKLPFDHPGFILFSSGTTGKPKCIIHSAAGILLKVLSEQRYHLDIRPKDRMLYSTTCGWMMWNWLLYGLGSGATIYLADGSPGFPELDRLFAIASTEKLSFLGVSAALIDSWRKADTQASKKYDFSSLRTIASTGSPLAISGFDWVKDQVGSEVRVASIAGGTDLCGCLVLGVATEPVVPGEIQGPALGLEVKVVRADGSETEVGEDGELICKTPFPTVPLGFWGDADRKKISAAYFDRFEGVWAHGDHARRTESGGFEIIGRLDATLNSKGVRIGTAEIYRIVTTFPEVQGALAASQPEGNDTRVVLFLETKGELTDELKKSLRLALRTKASPRHVPELMVKAPELPRTRNGKLNELAVSDILMRRPERDSSSLANPEVLDWFREFEKEYRP